MPYIASMGIYVLKASAIKKLLTDHFPEVHSFAWFAYVSTRMAYSHACNHNNWVLGFRRDCQCNTALSLVAGKAEHRCFG